METENLLKFFREIGGLKETPRKGWVIDGIENPESVADHSYGVALMTLVLGGGRKDIDLMKALKMALLHDLQESVTGDMVPMDVWEKVRKTHGKLKGHFDDVTLEEKTEREREAFEKMSEPLGSEGKEYLRLWEELEAGKTREAVFVKGIDRLELALQALEYAEKYPGKDLYHYIKFAGNDIKDPQIRVIFNKIVESLPEKYKNRKG